MKITEEHLECTECDWVGVESEAPERYADEDMSYDCPTCGGVCAHFPLDEIGDELPQERNRGAR